MVSGSMGKRMTWPLHSHLGLNVYSAIELFVWLLRQSPLEESDVFNIKSISFQPVYPESEVSGSHFKPNTL